MIGTGGSGGILDGEQGNIVLASLAGLGLAAQADYGGPTPTIALLSGSAAVGNGSAIDGITTDQRGFERDAATPDIGAFQTSATALVVTAATDNFSASGRLDLRGAVNLADVLGGPQTISFDPGVFATAQRIILTTGELELSSTTGAITIDGPGPNLLSVDGNQADRVFKIDPHVTATISGLTITRGSTISFGGGLYNGGTATLTDCAITGNSADYGGGLLSQGTIALDNCTISGNTADVEGGGIWTAGTATLNNCTISGNSSGDIGGGLNNRSAMLTLTACTISGNSAHTAGGGVYNQAVATFTGCTISGDSAAQNGGGLTTGIRASSTLLACTISGNTAQGGGGLVNYATTKLTNCTLSGNIALVAGGGVSNSGMVTLLACTISGNIAALSGAGFYNDGFLDNVGSGVLTDTIVAGNTVAGAANDIAGTQAARVTGSFNLIGPGGSGGIQNGALGNIVLPSVARMGLAPLGDYGGSIQTIALLPGSPALGAGTVLTGITTDARGEPLDSPIDIGAFQSQGFFLIVAAGASPQSAPTGEVFGNPLAVTVTARNPVEPVVGGVVSFAVTPEAGSGAAANLSAAVALIGVDHRALVTARANANEGSYIVTASTAGGLAMPQLLLTNIANDLVRLQFTGLSNETIVFGTATATFTGVLANGTEAPPQGEAVAVTFAGVTKQSLIGPAGAFTATFATAGLAVPGSPSTLSFSYTSDGNFASTSTTRLLMVTKATPTVDVSDAGGTFNNTAFDATATVTGVGGGSGNSLEGISPLLSFFSGTFTSAAQLAGRAPLSGAPSQGGSYTVVGRFAGSPDYVATESAPVNFTISQAGTHVILVQHSVRKHKKVVSVRLTAEVESLTPGAGNASGVVKFMVKKKLLGTLTLSGGQATLTVKASKVAKQAVIVVYNGDDNFQLSRTTARISV